MKRENKSAWKKTVYSREGLFYNFPCGCSLKGEDAKKRWSRELKKPGVFCGVHDTPCISINSACMDCGEIRTLPPNRTKLEYCDLCAKKRTKEKNLKSSKISADRRRRISEEARPFCIKCKTVKTDSKKYDMCKKCREEERVRPTIKIIKRGYKTAYSGCKKFQDFCGGFCIKERPFFYRCKEFTAQTVCK